MATTWVISKNYRTYARLVPDHERKRFAIEIVADATADQLEAAAVGTVVDNEIVYALDGETYRTRIETLRGDYRLPDGATGNRLRRWEKSDMEARPDDVFQERLYCIQWVTRETLGSFRPKSFFAAPTEADLERERSIGAMVRENLADWQGKGLVSDMEIESGAKTDEFIRTRGWTYWHHLFTPRHLLTGSLIVKRFRELSERDEAAGSALGLCRTLTWMSKLTRWNVGYPGRPGVAPSADTVKDVFYNQAFNTFYNYGNRSFYGLKEAAGFDVAGDRIAGRSSLECRPSNLVNQPCDLFVTDPPYADAINYDEITEYFIAWLRSQPPMPQWVWDSRRALAIRGSNEDFRRGMVEAYRAMARHMPDNGLQIVMFTHQDAGVWADMASVVWGAGLRVTAAWYIATETSSELKKGGYVQGTVLLVLRKRLSDESTYRDELVQEVRAEVARQIETMIGLNQTTRGHGRGESLFEDADLQMAGYAAALRVLTGYSRIDGQEMTAEALRPRQKGQKGVVGEIIDFAVQVANEHLVPEGLTAATWERLSGPERFYLKMVDLETNGVKKLDNYQNFAKAFRFGDYTALMASLKPNAARLKTAAELKRAEFESNFGRTPLRSLLYALYELEREVDIDEVMGHLRDMVPGYHARREDLMTMAAYLAAKRERPVPGEAQAARILLGRIQNERLGG
jgi:putative DNA methylase